MKWNPIAGAGLAFLGILSATGCSKIAPISAPGGRGGSADFSVIAAMGTSISAGVQSGGLVVTHQQKAFPYLFAKQAGAASFTIPSVSADGIPPLLRLLSLSPLVISNTGRVAGVPTHFSQATAYHNMAVPSALLLDVADSTTYYGGPLPRDPAVYVAFGGIVRHRGTILSEVASLSPTFVTFEFGSIEVLAAATRGSGAPLVDPFTFGLLLTGTMNGLAAVAPTAKFAIVNVPDVTSIPFVTTFPPFALNASGQPLRRDDGTPRTLFGDEGSSPDSLAPNDFILLSAADSLAIGVGFPVGTRSYLTGAPGNGRPLPNSMVLSHSEAALLRTRIAAYNVAIDSVAAGRGGAVVDLNALFRAAATTGIAYQGTRYTSAFITGGLFSLDGVHPNDLAQGMLANALIDAVNAKFGASVPRLDLATVASPSSSRLRPASDGGRVLPWILEAESVYARMFPWRELSAP